MFLDLFPSDGDKAAMVHVNTHCNLRKGNQMVPLFQIFPVRMDGIDQNKTVIVKFSFGKHFLKGGCIQSVHKKKVDHLFVKLYPIKVLFYQFLDFGFVFYVNTFTIEIGYGLQKNIDTTLFVKSFFGIKTFGHILEHIRGMYAMLVCGLR